MNSSLRIEVPQAMDPNTNFLRSHMREIIHHPGRLFVGFAIHKLVRGNLALLLMRRHDNQPDPGLWEIPAGEVDETDDNIEEAVRRIVHEETGLEVFAIEDELPSLLLSRSGERPFIIQINFRIRVSEEFSTRVMAYPNRYDYMDVAWLTQDELVDYGLRRPIAMEELIDEAFCCIDQDADDGSDGAYWGTI